MSQALEKQFQEVSVASRSLAILEDKKINEVLHDLAQEAEQHIDYLLEENVKDLNRMSENDPKYDRLKLTEDRIKAIAQDIKNVAMMDSPLGKQLMSKVSVTGLQIEKISVPLGVIGVIYEARPNVTFDVFSLCLKSGNACILKGGSDAEFSNLAIISIIHKVLERHGLSQYLAFLLPADRSATKALLEAVNYVDIIIPRGSQRLIDYVRENSKVPTIETGAGIVHTYYDEFADLDKGKEIVFNAKTRRVSVCNALDCLVIHSSRVADITIIAQKLAEKNVVLHADKPSFEQLKGNYPSDLLFIAEEHHFGTEFLSHKMSIKTVNSLKEALDHIATYSSKHSESIVSENKDVVDLFLKSVDAAAVYANTSTAFTDGAQFGLGAEIGISTQKLHARGPMALDELTSYKWIVKSDGLVRA